MDVDINDQIRNTELKNIELSDKVESDIDVTKISETNKIDQSNVTGFTYPREFFSVIGDNKNVITRFPPEPNGFLHMGHVKAMEIDFSFAEDNKGICILRFDDTNPSAESTTFYDNIREDVNWMEYNYVMETNTSDYFVTLYELAITMIKQGDAYVCELSQEEIKRHRAEKIESPFKERPVEESLRLFEEMRDGKYPEGSMTLRMKGDLNNGNSTLWDVIMYRIIYDEHCKTGKEWVIYPSYDFSHCIIDSIENITHSFCTTEYEIRREQYYWFLDKLKMRKPYVYEFARLEVENETLSKRKIKEMVDNNIVFGWDDPRLLTIKGLRRRGYVPSALKEFCRNAGITKHETTLSRNLLENIVREKLNVCAPRKLVVMSPLKLIITNLTEEIICNASNFPFDKSSTTRPIILTNEVYIDTVNFKEIDEKNFYGLAPGKTVRLKYGPFVEFERHDKDSNVVFVKLVEPSNPKKIKGILNWVNINAEPIIIRKFNGMEITEYNCLAEQSLNKTDVKVEDKFQFEKYGFYCVDKDSENSKELIFNETVKLKSSY